MLIIITIVNLRVYVRPNNNSNNNNPTRIYTRPPVNNSSTTIRSSSSVTRSMILQSSIQTQKKLIFINKNIHNGQL